jgi:hypothetical protein
MPLGERAALLREGVVVMTRLCHGCQGSQAYLGTPGNHFFELSVAVEPFAWIVYPSPL